MNKIVVIGDDLSLLEILQKQLERDEVFSVKPTDNASFAMTSMANEDPDLVILDVQFSNDDYPEEDGIDICRRIRAEGYTIPVLMLIELNREADAMRYFEAGANDYIVKPLRMGELLERIKLQLKQHKNKIDSRLVIGSFYFVKSQKTLIHRQNGNVLILTEKETEIIQYLWDNNGKVANKTELLQEIWGYKSTVTTHTLETHVYRLRQKINEIDASPFLLTKSNGYCLA